MIFHAGPQRNGQCLQSLPFLCFSFHALPHFCAVPSGLMRLSRPKRGNIFIGRITIQRQSAKGLVSLSALRNAAKDAAFDGKRQPAEGGHRQSQKSAGYTSGTVRSCTATMLKSGRFVTQATVPDASKDTKEPSPCVLIAYGFVFRRFAHIRPSIFVEYLAAPYINAPTAYLGPALTG
jgi:hypothetical protein